MRFSASTITSRTSAAASRAKAMSRSRRTISIAPAIPRRCTDMTAIRPIVATANYEQVMGDTEGAHRMAQARKAFCQRQDRRHRLLLGRRCGVDGGGAFPRHQGGRRLVWPPRCARRPAAAAPSEDRPWPDDIGGDAAHAGARTLRAKTTGHSARERRADARRARRARTIPRTRRSSSIPARNTAFTPTIASPTMPKPRATAGRVRSPGFARTASPEFTRILPMRYRKLGRTGLAVSEICLGTMTFGGDRLLARHRRAAEQETATRW